MKEKLTKIHRDGKKLIRELKKEIQHIKPGKLYCKRVNGKTYYYEYESGKEHSITKNEKRIKALARYEILTSQVNVLEYNCKVLEAAINKLKSVGCTKDAYYASVGLPKGVYTKAQIEWMNEEYQRNPYHPEQLIYYSNNGVGLRSKSEQAIANRLEEKGIPYRAEPAMYIGGRIIYPDFVILLPNGDLLIWEHFGLMEDEVYRMKALDKIADYRKSGYVQHKNLICSYEEDIKSAEDIDQIIERFV